MSALDNVANEVQQGLRRIADLLETSGCCLARVSCQFKDGAVTGPVYLTEYRIPPARIVELIDHRDFQMPAELIPTLARLARLLAIDNGGLLVEYDHHRNVKWFDRIREVV